LTEGDSFGEQALHGSSVRGVTVKAKENDVRCVALSREALQNILGAKINEVVNFNWSRWCLEKNDTLQHLTKVQIERIIKSVKFKNYDAGTVI
jgi:cGMP-dependent protein kinase 1